VDLADSQQIIASVSSNACKSSIQGRLFSRLKLSKRINLNTVIPRKKLVQEKTCKFIVTLTAIDEDDKLAE